MATRGYLWGIAIIGFRYCYKKIMGGYRRMTQPQPQQIAERVKRFRAADETANIDIGTPDDVPNETFVPNPKMDLPPGITYNDYLEILKRDNRAIPADAGTARLWDYDESLTLDDVADAKPRYNLADLDAIINDQRFDTGVVISTMAKALARRINAYGLDAEKMWRMFTKVYRDVLTS